MTSTSTAQVYDELTAEGVSLAPTSAGGMSVTVPEDKPHLWAVIEAHRPALCALVNGGDPPPDDVETGGDEKTKDSTAEQLVKLALASYRLGRTEAGEVFAVEQNGPNIAVMLRGSSRALRARLAREYRAQYRRTPSASALTDAVCAIEGEGLDAVAEPVHLRVASHEDGIVIDLGDTGGRAVFVGPDGWRLLGRSPALFRRTELTAPMPVPERGGSLDELREILNVSSDAWQLLVGWMIAAMLPNIPHPVLLWSGVQGSGKSSAARTVISLIDPSGSPLRSEPRDVEDWQVAVAGSWCACIDNVSRIGPWFSDALCRVVTGDALVRRKLYTDADISIVAFRRVVMLTSIDAGAIRGDLGERLLLVDVQPMDEDARRTEQDLDAVFLARRPQLLGAILDALAKTLAALPSVRPGKLPRMADYAKVLLATDAAGVTNGAFALFLGQQGRIAADVVDADPFALAIVDFARRVGTWQGSATELVAELLPRGSEAPRGWPGRNSVKGRLRRLAPSLAAQGVVVTTGREGDPTRRRLIGIATRKGRDEIVQIVQDGDLPGDPSGEALDNPLDNPDILDDSLDNPDKQIVQEQTHTPHRLTAAPDVLDNPVPQQSGPSRGNGRPPEPDRSEVLF